ncbi:CHAT domain-containing protein, partial [Brunnivagina elsteri]
VALANLGRYEDAIASYDEALKFKPDDHEAWNNRGVAAGSSISVNQFLAFSSAIARQNPALNQRGYEGKLASYREGLKYCQQNTHPEGWGMLHQEIGNAHYFQGVGKVNYRQYWLKAEAEYPQALITLTKEAFPELHLKVLRDLISVLFALVKDKEAKQWRRQALEVFAQLLNSPDKSSSQKRKLEAEFSGFSQMRVDTLIDDGDFVSALEAAERNKNFYLTWILDALKEHILSPSYSDIQGLVNPETSPNTAIIYWHISPFALTTFIIKPGTDKPIIIPTQKPDKLTAWIKNWDEQYKNYRKGKKQQLSSSAWRDNLPQLLAQLSDLINITAILESIQSPDSHLQNLILIPHRDLHRFPLHALFPDNFTTNYLPSAQIGLTLNSQSQNLHPNIINSPKLLIVEYSGADREDEGLARLTYAEIESATIAQLFEHTNPKHISDNQANKTTVKQALAAGYNIFHFTGHGSYDSKHPKNSALYLSDDSADAKTNPDLTLPEIRNLNLSGYQLVSLSACETAITGNETIESEYVGLVSAFLYQGVSYIVSTLWTVNEISTSLLMIYFYRQIKAGKTPKIALAESTKWLRNLTYEKLEQFYQLSFSQLRKEDRIFLQVYLKSRESNPGELFEHPYYWAGFTITGS